MTSMQGDRQQAGAVCLRLARRRDVSLVPAAPAAQAQRPSQPAANPQAEVRRDYELALQLNNRQAWEFFVQQYPAGFYANLARVQLDKIAAEEGQRAATDKAKQAEAEKARLAAEGAKAAEQAKAAREAKAAEEARVAAEKQRQAEQAKADAAERARIAAERAAAEKLTKEKAEAEAKAIREKAQAEAKTIREKAESDAKAAEEARKAADKEAERLRLAALERAKTAGTAQVAALPPDASKTRLTPQELSRSLQAELRRVGCQTAAVGNEWNATSRRSLELFNRHAGMKLDAKLASFDALDAVKGKQSRICPLICEHGFRASGDRCEKRRRQRHAGHADAGRPAARRGALPDARIDLRQRRPVGAGEPEAKQVAAVLRFGEILIGCPRVHDPVIAHELHVAGPKVHVEMDRWVFGERVHRIAGSDQLRRQSRHFR